LVYNNDVEIVDLMCS